MSKLEYKGKERAAFEELLENISALSDVSFAQE